MLTLRLLLSAIAVPAAAALVYNVPCGIKLLRARSTFATAVTDVPTTVDRRVPTKIATPSSVPVAPKLDLTTLYDEGLAAQVDRARKVKLCDLRLDGKARQEMLLARASHTIATPHGIAASRASELDLIALFDEGLAARVEGARKAKLCELRLDGKARQEMLLARATQGNLPIRGTPRVEDHALTSQLDLTALFDEGLAAQVERSLKAKLCDLRLDGKARRDMLLARATREVSPISPTPKADQPYFTTQVDLTALFDEGLAAQVERLRKAKLCDLRLDGKARRDMLLARATREVVPISPTPKAYQPSITTQVDLTALFDEGLAAQVERARKAKLCNLRLDGKARQDMLRGRVSLASTPDVEQSISTPKVAAQAPRMDLAALREEGLAAQKEREHKMKLCELRLDGKARQEMLLTRASRGASPTMKGATSKQASAPSVHFTALYNEGLAALQERAHKAELCNVRLLAGAPHDVPLAIASENTSLKKTSELTDVVGIPLPKGFEWGEQF